MKLKKLLAYIAASSGCMIQQFVLENTAVRMTSVDGEIDGKDGRGFQTF